MGNGTRRFHILDTLPEKLNPTLHAVLIVDANISKYGYWLQIACYWIDLMTNYLDESVLQPDKRFLR